MLKKNIAGILKELEHQFRDEVDSIDVHNVFHKYTGNLIQPVVNKSKDSLIAKK